MYERVNPAHVDKVADRIAGALVDLAYTKEKNPRVAVEVLLGHGVCHIMAETSVHFESCEVENIVKRLAPKLTVDYLPWRACDGGTETTDRNGKEILFCFR